MFDLNSRELGLEYIRGVEFAVYAEIFEDVVLKGRCVSESVYENARTLVGLCSIEGCDYFGELSEDARKSEKEYAEFVRYEIDGVVQLLEDGNVSAWKEGLGILWRGSHKFGLEKYGQVLREAPYAVGIENGEVVEAVKKPDRRKVFSHVVENGRAVEVPEELGLRVVGKSRVA